MSEIKVGARVKLTEKFVRGLNKSKKSRNAEWGSRRATVVQMNPNNAILMWDHRTTRDVLPVKALEVLPPQ